MKKNIVPKRINMFECKTSKDFFEIFSHKVSLFNDDELDTIKMMDCVLYGWSLIDWIVKDIQIETKESIKDKFKNYTENLYSLDLLQDLCNHTKHYIIDKYNSKIECLYKASDYDEKYFNPDFFRTEPNIKVKLIDNKHINFKPYINKVCDFYKHNFLKINKRILLSHQQYPYLYPSIYDLWMINFMVFSSKVFFKNQALKKLI